MKRAALLLVAFLALSASVATVGCQKSSISTETLLVPGRADGVAKVKVAEILNDEDIADLYARYAVTDPYAPQTLRLALDEFKEETGIDLRYFDEAVVFGDLSTLETGTLYCGAIVECNIPAKYFFEAFCQLTDTDFETEKYDGYKIYTLDGEVSIVFLNKELIAIGPQNAVKDVIDVGLGKAKPISGELYELYAALGNPLYKGACKVPWAIGKEIPPDWPPDEERSVDVRPLRDVGMVGVVLDKNGSAMNAQIQLHFRSSASAIDTSECIKNLKAWTRYIMPLAELTNIVDAIHVVVYDSRVSVELDVTLSEIKDLIGALGRGNHLQTIEITTESVNVSGLVARIEYHQDTELVNFIHFIDENGDGVIDGKAGDSEKGLWPEGWEWFDNMYNDVTEGYSTIAVVGERITIQNSTTYELLLGKYECE